MAMRQIWFAQIYAQCFDEVTVVINTFLVKKCELYGLK
jgi:hypothetical protein